MPQTIEDVFELERKLWTLTARHLFAECGQIKTVGRRFVIARVDLVDEIHQRRARRRHRTVTAITVAAPGRAVLAWIGRVRTPVIDLAGLGYVPGPTGVGPTGVHGIDRHQNAFSPRRHARRLCVEIPIVSRRSARDGHGRHERHDAERDHSAPKHMLNSSH